MAFRLTPLALGVSGVLRVRTSVSVARPAATGAVFLLMAVGCGSAVPVKAQPGRVAQRAVVTPKATTTTRAVVTRWAGVTQRAIGLSLPRGPFVYSLLDCPSVAGCVATFNGPGRLFVLGEHRGTWRSEAAPAGVSVVGLACPSLGSCVGAGLSGPSADVVTQSGRRWRASVVQLPGTPAGVFAPRLSSVSCGSVGNCTAVGSFNTPFPHGVENHVLLVSEKAGTWGTGFAVQLPPDAATTTDDNGFGPGGIASVVSCPSAGNCAASGTYAAGPEPGGYLNRPEAWVATEQAGEWGHALGVQLPGTAAAAGQFGGFTGLSCPSAGNCTAAGGYQAKGGEQGLIVTERNGVWSPATQAPLPHGGVAPGDPNEFVNPLYSVSCASPNDCAAIGAYVKKSGRFQNRPRGWLLSKRHGTWRASKATLAGPGGKVSVPGYVSLNSVNCPSPGNCVAVGTYDNGGHGLIEIERNGTWRPGIRPALPANAAPKKAWASLYSVSCASTNHCTALGVYTTRTGKAGGLIINLQIG